jgi:tetratricopeptide (TPR) repeat protein
MADTPSPDKAETAPPSQPEKEGGITVGDAAQTTVGGDVVGRDKQEAGGNIINVAPGSNVTVITGPTTPPAPPPFYRRLKLTRQAAALVVVAAIAVVGLLFWIVWKPSPTPTPGAPTPIPLSIQSTCPNDFTARFESALKRKLVENKVVVSVESGGLPDSGRVVLRIECSTQQAIYHFTFPYSEARPEAKVAELATFDLTGEQEAVDVPAAMAAGIAAYYNDDPAQGAALFAGLLAEWKQPPPLENAGLEFLLGNARLKQGEAFYEDAIEHHTKALERATAAGENQTIFMAKIHNNLGRVFIEQFDYERALEQLSSALEMPEPGYVWLLLNRSEVLLETDRFEEAIDDCNTAIKQKGKFAPAYVCLAAVIYRRDAESRPGDQLLENARQAIESDSTYAPAYYYAGIGSCWQGAPGDAINYFRQASGLSYDPALRSKADDWRRNVEADPEICQK